MGLNNDFKDFKDAIEYHEATKHSELSIQLSRHYLDWDNKPRPFKIYTKLPSISLPRDFSQPTMSALKSINGSIETIKPKKNTSNTGGSNSKQLAEILFFSAGITREMNYPYGTYYMRAASATGALYPIELYVINQTLPDLKAGVYHFCPGEFTLTELRQGDYRAELAEATSSENESTIISSPVTIVFTSIAWRNAWKYQARSYRHWFWDAGVIAANMLATTNSIGLPTNLIMGFVDATINRLLGLTDKKEAAIALATVGGVTGGSSPDLQFLESKKSISVIRPEILPLSKMGENDYPEIWKIHDSSCINNKEQVDTWVNSSVTLKREMTAGKSSHYQLPLKHDDAESLTEPSLGSVILMRGSTRRFAQESISYSQLSNILHHSSRVIPLDFLKELGESIVDFYFIVNDVKGLEPGSYFFNQAENSLEQLKRGTFRSMSEYLCLGQQLFREASVVFFLMTDLQAVLKAFGNRGYRAAQFEAGIIAGKIYLSSYAQGLGASGSTFYDDAVTEFFSPHSKDKSTMITIGVGVPGYRSKPGKILAGRLTKTDLLKEYA
jgi:SagB-type dehydrogenase family enzyme